MASMMTSAAWGLGMLGGDGVRVLIEAEGDQIVLERGDSVESPRGVGDDLRELLFEEADGLEVVGVFVE
jgi:hypothetical protein